MENANIGVLFRNNESIVIPFFFFLRKSIIDFQCRVVVLDNGSTDNTLRLLKENMTLQDILLHSDDNVGVAKGRNLIVNKIKEVSGEYPNLFLLDSDVFVIKRYSLNRMFEMLNADSSLGMICGKTLSYDSKSTGFVEKNDGICFSLTNKTVFDIIGFFDEQFEMFYDDTDFMNSIIRNGMKIGCCEDAVAVHCWGTTITSGSESNRRQLCLDSDGMKFNKKMSAVING